jgi:hypothetical protein
MMKAMGARLNASRFRFSALTVLGCAVALVASQGEVWAAPKAKASAKFSEDAKYIKPFDISKIEGTPLVLVNPNQEVVVVFPENKEGVMFFGTAAGMYQQLIYSRSRDGDNWTMTGSAPRISQGRGGSIARQSATEYQRYCGNDKVDMFTPMAAPDSAAFLAKAKFFTSPLYRTSQALGRDSSGTYYYVDALRREFGGAGYRVFVGRKGAMKQRPLLDVASDTAGMVFSTKSGEMRLVTSSGASDAKGITWYAKGKATELIMLDTYMESNLIFRDLGIYGFLGTLCDTY